jgi:hypothetical protein
MVHAKVEFLFPADLHSGNISLTPAHSGSTSGAGHNLFIEDCPRRIKSGPLLVGYEIWEIEGIPTELCRWRKSQ